jgi:hypothetical protein
MAQRTGYPLYKVQRPMCSSSGKGEQLWILYTEKMRANGEYIQLPENLIPDRLRRAMGRAAYKVYAYLNVTLHYTCGCDAPCKHDPDVRVEYVAREPSTKKCQW